MSIIRSPLVQLALMFVSFSTLAELSYARVDSFCTFSPTMAPEEIDLQTRIAREWNERIPPGFWEVSSQVQPNGLDSQVSFSYEKLERQLSQLQFEFHQKHLTEVAMALGIESGVAPLHVAQSTEIHEPISLGPSPKWMPPQFEVAQAAVIPQDRLQGYSSIQAPLSLSPSFVHGVSLERESLRIQQVQQDSNEQRGQISFVEALDRFQAPLEGVDVHFLSSEPVGEEVRGWQSASLVRHWPTLNWYDPQSEATFVPLLGQNTIALLESRFGVKSERTAGIIFGRVKAGWRVEISDRAERPIFMDDSGILTDQDNVMVDRHFIFLNAAPGAQMVFAESVLGHGTGAVAIPVLSSVSTYVDLTHLQSVSLSGKVLEKTVDPSSLATLRVVGQPSAVAGFHLDHEFRLESVVVVNPYPLYLETDRGDGYTQRYRVLSDEIQDLVLTRFSRERVEKWRAQISFLQNGMSAESGMLVAAFPGLVDQWGDDSDLSVRIRPIPESAQLKPVVYVRAPNGSLQQERTIAPHEDFIVGAQISDGPFLLEVVNQAQQVVYSELSFASPGVLNIFNPK